jgi:Uma2 family endonuclease
LHCLNAGSNLGWLIDPDEKSVLVYPNGKQPIFFQEPEQLLPVPDFMGDFQLTIGELFAWLKPGNT